MKLHMVLIVAVVLITSNVNCGVIEGVYDKVSNTTQAVKEDVYSWWSYGVDTVMGDVNKDAANPNEGNADESGMIGKLYNRVKGGVSSGYMKIHNYVLGEDSDPNKGIIKTLYERALKRLSNIKSFVFGNNDHAEKPESHKNEEGVKEEMLKLLFSNKTDIFNTESEKSALNSLRSKLTQSGDEVLNLADSEKELIRKAYENVRHKSDELLTNAKESADKMKNKINENVDKTKEFIQGESKKVEETAQNIGEEVKTAANDIEKKVQSE